MMDSRTDLQNVQMRLRSVAHAAHIELGERAGECLAQGVGRDERLLALLEVAEDELQRAEQAMLLWARVLLQLVEAHPAPQRSANRGQRWFLSGIASAQLATANHDNRALAQSPR